jgi:hypothetical protein
LLLCWQFVTVCQQLKPIEKLMMKLKKNAQKNPVRRIIVDSIPIAD